MIRFRNLLLLLLALICLLPVLTSFAQEGDPCATVSDLGNEPDYHIGRGDSFFGQQDYTHAIEAYTCAIKLDATYLPGYVNRGYAYAVQRNDPLALEDYNAALAIDPDSISALNNRGMLYLGQGRFQQAIDDFDRVITLAPDAPTGYLNRAIVHASEGNYDFALEDLEQVMALDPEFAPAYATRGAIYLALANDDYAEYAALINRPRLPTFGYAGNMLQSLAEDRKNEGFASWLLLLTPIREATP